jgi:hypothetical protein
MNPLGVLRPLDVFRSLSQTGEYARVPIVLTDADGTVFTDADGNVLTYGTQRVRISGASLTPEEEFMTADGIYYAAGDGSIYAGGGA